MATAAPYRRAPLWDTITGILNPWAFLYLSLTHIPPTALPLLKSLSFGTLLSWSRFQPLWFASFWSIVGPNIRTGNGAIITSLLQGRVTKGKPVSSAEETSHHGIGGTVLEIGAGSGLWVNLFTPDHCTSQSTTPVPGERTAITKVFGVEPNASVHGDLKRNIAAAKLENTYEIVPVGIEDALASGRIPEGGVDCIVSVLCLCSIPDPDKNIALLYKCLKPGGRWYVFEHVRTFEEQGRFMRWYQALVNIFWPRLIGGCYIDRDTTTSLQRAGPWTDIDLAQPPAEEWFHTVPHIFGILTK
ncbi:S-adenosyl-L-methionine-dependent methyltransferase [Podospora aff. communis PSN243]|uniref:S-adenosyl-L-methionine-dependent methyltransferase n=1 Tax=Podospora aff. communis PSN243 TaxID=3040156 RepID=A0AAV9GJ83_9PEZI|nr:S-adenosyl-L-methionine-dependent methyltransferase [Podospora aff. communis PSN243]